MPDLLYRFGDFRLSPARFELTREGEPIRLERKPLQLLLLLAEHRDRVVSRTEIAAHLWNEKVFVDTEHGINTAIRKLRVALGETSDAPRFLQTVTGRGYRLLAELDAPTSMNAPLPPAVAASGLPEAAAERAPLDHSPIAQGRRSRALQRALLGVAVLGVLCFILLFWGRSDKTQPAAKLNGPGIALQGEAAAGDVPEEAREQYQAGLYLLDRRKTVGSTAAFRRAIALAPRFAAAYAGLAQSLDAQAKQTDGVPGSTIPLAIAAARQAIALDPGSDAGYVALGSIQTAFTWEWKEAEQNLLTGLRLNPHNATGHIWYAVLLQDSGRNSEALQQARLAVVAEPLSFFAVRMLASIHFYARDFDEADKVLQRAQRMTSEHPNLVDHWMSLVQEQKGLYDEAVAHDLLWLQQNRTASDVAQLRKAYKRGGWQGFWEARAGQLSRDPMTGCTLYMAGVANLRLHRTERALTLLKAAADQHCFWMGMVRTDPVLDPLRNEPRFHSIMAQVTAPGSGQ